MPLNLGRSETLSSMTPQLINRPSRCPDGHEKPAYHSSDHEIEGSNRDARVESNPSKCHERGNHEPREPENPCHRAEPGSSRVEGAHAESKS